MTSPIVSLLFRKRNTIDEVPWLRGDEEHTFTAQRNKTGRARVSAILARALVSALQGYVVEAYAESTIATAIVTSRTTGRSAPCQWHAGRDAEFRIPHGAPNKVTYHVGILALIDALAHPAEATDLLDAYQSLLQEYLADGLVEDLKPSLCRAIDEAYYWLRFRDAEPDDAHDRLMNVGVTESSVIGAVIGVPLNVRALTDLKELEALRAAAQPPAPVTVPKRKSRPVTRRFTTRFVGWQAEAVNEALLSGENVLLAGPTGTGKTFALQQVMEHYPDWTLVVVEGKEGLMDLDFLGAILPTEDDRRVWQDGPVFRAMHWAQAERVVLFLDEINRVPRKHLNILLGLMNVKPARELRQMGYAVAGEGHCYLAEAPMTSEVVWCPVEHLSIVAAGNFGRAYAVSDLDPAVRRRFDTLIEFDYLGHNEELELVLRETDVNHGVAEYLVKVAAETRRMLGNAELPGCIDTASLLNWARKCARVKAKTVGDVMKQAQLTWADLACGRDHTGRINQANFQALSDYLKSLGGLSA